MGGDSELGGFCFLTMEVSMLNMKVTESERRHLRFMRLLRASMCARKWVYWLAVRFGTEQYLRVQSGKFEVRQFFGVQYLIK